MPVCQGGPAACIVTRTQPSQKRSRERVDQILLAAAEIIAKSGSPDSLTTTSVSNWSGMSVATIYRYFVDRYNIMAALIDRELEVIDAEIDRRIGSLERISIDTLLDAMFETHFEHFQENRRAVVLWYGVRESAEVRERVERRHAALSDWLTESLLAAGMLRDDYPWWGAEGIVWVCDCSYEFIFKTDRTPTEQKEIADATIEMLSDQIRKFATPRGIDGVPTEEFIQSAGRFGAVGNTTGR